LHSSPNIITMIKSGRTRWERHVGPMRKKINVYSMSLGKPERKRPLRKPRCTWENNIKMNLRQIGWGGMDFIHLAQDTDQWRALVKTVMNLRVPQYCQV
jgi:hypothetical protein